MSVTPIDLGRDDELASRGLPEVAYIQNGDGRYGKSPIIAVKRGEAGYYQIFSRAAAAELNARSGVSTAQVGAMLAGSMFGWDSPAAWPQAHEEPRITEVKPC